ncbi:hypothetical protein Taro_035983 [Colocasia esculenta]|uniref:Uncharacterized protein n=1 Tax=Colocasia esculenta TaxID=4460 RepID=A0A843WKB0_COLES|nr:hypothetical protein [Colocasia esculenta]
MPTAATETPEVTQVLLRPPSPSRYHRDGKGNRNKHQVATRQRVMTGNQVTTRLLSRRLTAARYGHGDRGDASSDVMTHTAVATSDERSAAGMLHPGVAHTQ